MPENQGHGKIWEKDLAMNVYKATEAELDSVSHTAPVDVPRSFNRLDGIDISIKTSGKGAVDMGNIVRLFNEVSSGEILHLAIVEWEQLNSTTKRVKRIIEIDLTNSVQLLFGTATLSKIVELVTYVKAIPHYGCTAEHRKTYKRMASALKKEGGGLISYAVKVDHATQRRVQGHFAHFSRFVKEHPARLIAESNTCEFRGGRIAEEIQSTKRVRNNKKKPVPGSAAS